VRHQIWRGISFMYNEDENGGIICSWVRQAPLGSNSYINVPLECPFLWLQLKPFREKKLSVPRGVPVCCWQNGSSGRVPSMKLWVQALSCMSSFLLKLWP
jgi:hypothetical protein